MLKTEIIWPNHRRYKSRTEWEPVGFFSDCLCNATRFDLMLGFFSSSAIIENEYKLGIIRYSDNYDKYYKDMLEEKGLSYELVAEFSYVLIMSRDNPLAEKETITYEDLSDYIEIAHADPYVPTLSMSKVFREELPDKVDQRIFVFERASQFDLLSENPKTFMWVSPASQQILDRYNLVQRVCEGNKKVYKDVLIYHKGYKLTKLDKDFITALCNARRKFVK